MEWHSGDAGALAGPAPLVADGVLVRRVVRPAPANIQASGSSREYRWMC